MVQALNRSRAKRTPPSLADQLYPEDGPQDASPDDEDKPDVPEETGAPRTPMQRAADSLYPENGRGGAKEEDAGDTGETDQDADDAGGEQEDEDDSDDDSSDEGAQPTQGANGPAAQTGADRVHAVLRVFGVKGEPGSKEVEAMAKLDAGVRKAIADAEESKGAPLTPDEEQNISGEYIADHAMKWLRLRNIAAEKLSEAMWKDAGHDPKSNCGTFFRKHLEPLGGNMDGRKSSAAKDWGPVLVKNGYEPVNEENYAPQDGDVRIYGSVTPRDPKNPKPAELYGHIQVYNAMQKKWVSEYRQNQDVPPAFQRKDAKFVTYRFNPF